MKHSRWWVGASALSLVLGACIIRQPGSNAPGAQEASEAQATEKPLPPGEQPTGNYGKVEGDRVLGGKGLDAFQVQGKTERVATSLIDVEGQPFDKALRVEIKEKSQNLWDVQLQATSETDVKRGDVMLASFYFRTQWSADESGEAETEINVELNREPWDKSVTYSVRSGPEWKHVHVPFKASRHFKAGEAQVVFRLGYPKQTIEFADVKLENFKRELVLADLPRTKATYAGMDPDAPWRAKAAERIEKIRKAELTVKVVGSDGKPVADASVTAKLSRHSFQFGTCAPAEYLISKQEAREKFKGILLDHFNTVTLENDLKWEPLAGDWGGSFTLDRANAGIDWVLEHDLMIRGHVLVWPGWENLPASLKRMQGDPEAVRQKVIDHITEVVTSTKGRLDHWDVVNEPFTNHDLLDMLGHEVMVDWFKLARSLDSKPKLFINDFAILNGGGGTTAHRDHYEKMIQLLVDNGAPLDGIGMQGHFGSSLTSPDDLMKILDRYAKFEKEIAVTEYDIVVDDEALAASYTRDFYTTLFSHPSVTSIVMWGFWDTAHWKKNAAMYRKDWSLKPAGQAYQQLVNGEWSTNAEGKTDASGRFSTRGFKGTYEVVVKAGGDEKTVKATLGDGGATVDVKI